MMKRLVATIGTIQGLLAFAAALTGAAPAAAQTPPSDGPVSTVDDIVVTARRSGAPVWRIENGEATVILVGSLSSVPADTPWRPQALEAAVMQADSIVLSQSTTMSLGDFFRMRRARARLPEGTTVSDYLTPEWRARLTVLERRHRRDYADRGLTWIAADLTGDRLRYRPGSGPSAESVVRETARKGRLPVELVGDMNGRHLDEAVSAPDTAQVACLIAAIEANEAGAEAVRARGLSWTRQRVPAVLTNPVERAQDRCQWWADETLRANGRAQWSEAVTKALTLPVTTMVVAPISVIAEPSGLLDQIVSLGLDVAGPPWKDE